MAVILPSGPDPCASGVVDVGGRCCAAHVDATTGVCCDVGAPVDAHGRCCAAGDAVDACGVCGGDGVVTDAAGRCCPVPLSPAMTCCEAGFDDCGVCEGRNECLATVEVAIGMSVVPLVSAADVAKALGQVDAAQIREVRVGASGGGRRVLEPEGRALQVCGVVRL